MKKIIKSKIFLVIITAIIVMSISIYAAIVYKATDFTYNVSNGSSKSVSDVLNELYDKMNTGGCATDVAIPTLGTGMIPVTISDNGTVKYADTNSKWYNYCDKKWANAVILSSGSYSVGDTIPESSIQSYFVWIPRYRYKLWNVETSYSSDSSTFISKNVYSNVHSIEIEFETKDTAPSTGSNNGEWLTHPAFTSFNSNGFWVGKFDTGYNGATSTSAAQVNANEPTKVIIKPNVYSWRYIKINNIFLTSYNYKRDLDSHMMKNTEWGAVAYLSHSVFGINYEVNTNNNSSFKTGYSALPSINLQTFLSSGRDYTGDGSSYNQPYNTEVGYLASTTGNITGVYDMSGGANEYVAGYYYDLSSASSSFEPSNYDSKYYDVYETYGVGILGDATTEMGPFTIYKDGDGWTRNHNSWYADQTYFVNSYSNYYTRGGHINDGGLASQFSHSSSGGSNWNDIGFRIVLTPQ